MQQNQVFKIDPENVQLELDQVALDTKLLVLKQIVDNGELNEATVNIWVTNVSTTNKQKRFTNVKKLQVSDKDLVKFKSYVIECIVGNEHISILKNINTNQDNRFFYVESAATDAGQLSKDIAKGNVLPVKDTKELNDFNAYAIQLTFGEAEYEKNIFAFNYIRSAWSVNNSSGSFLRFSYYENELIANIEREFRFQLTSEIDFIHFADGVYIANIKKFETAMNYHERLKQIKEDAITSMCQSSSMIEASKTPLRKAIGTDKHLMRQLASVYEKEYYKNDLWLKKLQQAADDAGNWKIKFDENGKIIVEDDKEYVKELLILLQNKRVKTIVDGEIFDVDGELIAVQK